MRFAVELAKTNPACAALVGVHPHYAAKCSEQLLNTLRRLAAETEVKAWGKTRLDFNRMYYFCQDEEKWFVRQLDLTAQLGLPLIFNERDSGSRFLEMLRPHAGKRLKVVVHCFGATKRPMSGVCC